MLQDGRLAGQIRENDLRDVLRKLRVSSDLPQRCRINEVQMTPDQFREGVLVAILGIAAK
jgi:hypothetical protein